MKTRSHHTFYRYLKCALSLILAFTCTYALAGCKKESASQSGNDQDVLVGFPLYPGMTKLTDRVEFKWKNLDSAYTVPDSYWAYYSVPANFMEVAAFYRIECLKPPHSNKELYWKETAKGVLSAYYQEGAKYVYSRIWFIPHPLNDSQSYLIVMRNNDIGGCSIF